MRIEEDCKQHQGNSKPERKSQRTDGHFVEHYAGHIQAGGCTDDGISFQLRRCMKGTMDTVLRQRTDLEDYEQWTYTTACGVTVLMALGEEALIFADNPQSFVSVWFHVIESNKSGKPITRERLQELADSIDFSIL